jgi:hypothetical protein
MKAFAPFTLAGFCLLVGFSIPALEQAAFLFAWIGFGPAIVFAFVLIVVARRSLSKGEMAAVAVASLFAYWAGEFFYIQMKHRLYFSTAAYLSPGIGASALLAGLALIKRRGLALVGLGSVLSLASSVPVWIGTVIPLKSYVWWGVHILSWYVLVGPFAAKILTGPDGHAQKEPNQSLEPTSPSVTDRADARSAPAAAVAHL